MADFDPKAYLAKKAGTSTFDPKAYLAKKKVDINKDSEPDEPNYTPGPNQSVELVVPKLNRSEWQKFKDEAGIGEPSSPEAAALAKRHAPDTWPTPEERAQTRAEVAPLVPKAEEALTSARRAALSGFTLGAAPKIVAAFENPEEAEKTKQTYEKANAEHPIFNMAGSLALPLPGVGKLAGLKKYLALAGIGGGASGFAAYNNSKADTVGGKLADAAIPAAAGAVITPVLGALPDVGEALANRFGKAAGNQGAKAIGLRPGIDNAADKLGMDAADVTKLGNEAREAKLIPFGGTKEAVRSKTRELLKSSGNKINEVADELNKSGVEPDFDMAAFDAQKNLANIKGIARDAELTPDQIQAAKLAFNHINNLIEAGEAPSGTYDWKDMLGMKSNAWKTVNKQAEAPLNQQLLEDAVAGTSESINNQIRSVNPDLADKLANANSEYGTAKLANRFSRKAATREQALQTPGLNMLGIGSSAAGGGAMLGHGGAAAGAILGAIGPWVNYIAKRRGAAVATHLLAGVESVINGSAPLLMSTSENAAKMAALTTPELRAEFFKHLSETKPDEAEKLADDLSKGQK